jgi:hypothetical protein
MSQARIALERPADTDDHIFCQKKNEDENLTIVKYRIDQ